MKYYDNDLSPSERAAYRVAEKRADTSSRIAIIVAFIVAGYGLDHFIAPYTLTYFVALLALLLGLLGSLMTLPWIASTRAGDRAVDRLRGQR